MSDGRYSSMRLSLPGRAQFVVALLATGAASCSTASRNQQNQLSNGLPTTASASLPPWLIGRWTREWIERRGVRSSTSTVHYLQTPSLFADVRFPNDRPSFAHAKSFADLSDAELRVLARQRGFAGRTTTAGDTATWHHEIDFQPSDTSADIGRLERVGDSGMYEHALDSSYVESWKSVARGDGRFLAVRVERAGRLERTLLVVGDHFLYVRNRAKDLPAAPSIDSLIVATHATRAQIIEFLDCELSVGRVRGGSVPWAIERSTLPWLEGRPLAFADEVAVSSPAAFGPRTASSDRWSLPVNTLTAADLATLFPQQR